MRNFWILVVLVLWALLATKMCSDYSACCSDGDQAEEIIGAVAPPVSNESSCIEGMICFPDNSCEPNLAENFSGFKDSLVSLCLLYTSPSPRDQRGSRMPSSA